MQANFISATNLKALGIKCILAFLIFGFVPTMGKAQTRSLSTLPILQSDNFSSRQSENLNHTEAYARCLKIYNQLVAARGDFRFPVPSLVLRREVSKVASIDYDRLEIVLEEKAYQACEPYGDAAIAFLLGHELTHYYEKHAWRRGFVSEFSDLQIAKDLSKLQDQISYETEADYLGGFLAYSAGFGLFNEGGDVIKNLYTAYQVKDPIPGYPALHDRIELSKKTNLKLKQLVELFDMANYLSAVGMHAEAREYYKYILMQYQSRELYNNLGMSCFLEALSYFKKEELVFEYALQLDMESSASRGSEDILSLRTSLLKQGIQYFDAAISMDPDYIPAYLNKANAYAILGDSVRAKFYAEQEALVLAQNKSDFKSIADIKNLMGILKLKEGDPVKAEQLWNESIALGGVFASNNLYLLKNGKAKSSTKSIESEPQETIQGRSLDAIAENFEFDRSSMVYLDGGNRYCQQFIDLDSTKSSQYFFNKCTKDINGSNQYILFNKCNASYTGSSRLGIKIGSRIEDVVLKYGKPLNTIGTTTGELLVYPFILFITDRDHKVVSWINYATYLK